jgi:hypothetical protein
MSTKTPLGPILAPAMENVTTTRGKEWLKDRVATRSRAIDWGPWRQATVILVTTRVVFFSIAYAANWFLASGEGRLQQGLFEVWQRWDSAHFFSVAEHGYAGPGSDPLGTAFFPLYPLSIRALGVIGVGPLAAGLAVSAGASLVAFAFLHRLAEQEHGDGAGRRAVLYLALFPTSVFLAAPYSEALFLAGAIPAFYYARRSQWSRVGAPAAVAMGTRAAGIFLLFGLALELLRQRRLSRGDLRRAAAAIAIGVLPLAAYAAYLWAEKGSPGHFLAIQEQGWGRTLTSPVTAFLNTWNTWEGATYPTNWIFAWRMEIAAASVGVALTIWALVRSEWGYAGYMGATMVALMTSSWYFSIPRMLLSLFPAVLLLAGWTGGGRDRHELALVVMAPVAALGVVVFTSGAWFY